MAPSAEGSSTLVDVKQRASSDCFIDAFATIYQQWARQEPLQERLGMEGFSVEDMAQQLQQWQEGGYTLEDLETLAKEQLQQMLEKRRAGNLSGICLLPVRRTQLIPSLLCTCRSSSPGPRRGGGSCSAGGPACRWV